MAERNVDLIIRARDDATKAFKSVSSALDDLAAIQKGVAAGSADVSKSLKNAETSAESLTKAIGQQSQQSGAKAEAAYKKVAAAVDTARGAFERQERSLRETRAQYDALRAQLEAAGRAVDSFRVRNEAAADGRFKERLKAAEKGYASLEKQVRRASAAVESEQQSYDKAASGYNQMSAAATEAEKALAKLQQRQRNAKSAISVEEQRQLADALRQSASGAGATAAQQQKLAAAFRGTNAQASAMRGDLRQVIRDLTFMGPAAADAASGLRKGAAEATNMRRALAAFYGDSRRALSLMQRLRGEVLSLTASFVGFYGVFRTGSSFLEAFQTTEAATNRLGAAFDQNATKVRNEMAFLSDEAKRLGIEFGVVSDQYSKFLISGQQAGLETAELRKIFVQVAEAGRVLKLSNDQISGTFTAMSQIAGKGTLQMEELRQQIGDRLPGAVGLLAQALGYGEDELDKFYKAVENGQVGAREALTALGQGLEDTYGGQLSDALDTVTTKIGAFQNLLFERRMTAANSGFIQGLETALDALNEFLDSDEGIRFFEELGNAFGRMFELLPGVLENVDLIVDAFQALIAIKVAQVASGIAGNFSRMVGPTERSRQAILAFNASLYRLSPAAAAAMNATTRLGTTLRGLRTIALGTATALRAAFAALGGPIGIAVAALTYFATESVGLDDTTVRLNQTLRDHEDILRDVREAYRDAEEGAGDYAEKLGSISVAQLKENSRQLREELAAFYQDDAGGADRGSSAALFAVGDAAIKAGSDAEQAFLKFERLNNEFKTGQVPAREVRAALDALSQMLGDTTDEVTEYLGAQDQQLEKAEELQDAYERNEAALALLNGTATDAQKELLGLADASEEAADSMTDVSDKVDAFQKALNALAENVPELDQKLKEFEAVKEIEQQFQDAITAARALPDAIMRAAAEANAVEFKNASLDALFAGNLSSGFTGASSGVEAAEQLIMEKEGFRATPYWDVNAYRAGFGSDTVTLDDGSIRKITQGMRVSREDAARDLRRRITDEFMPIARQAAGADRFDSFNPQQQGALTSIAYNYGEIPSRIINELRSGTVEEIANAIRGLAGDNGGINRRRRNEEAAIFGAGVGTEGANERAFEKLDAQREYNDELQKEIEAEEFKLSLQDEGLIDREVAKALREAEIEAQEKGVQLSAEQRKQIEQITRAKYAQEAADEARNLKLEEAARMEEKINLLQERRQRLQDRLDSAREQGDMVGAANIETELESVDAQLEELINKAIQFWQALGGEGSAAALQKLQFAKQDLQEMGQQVVVTGQQISTMMAGRAASAIDRFAERVAAGEDAATAFKEEFLRMAADILRQIAQMIIQQAIFNAISGGAGAGGGGGLGGGIAGWINGLFHGGGIAGGASQTRTVNPAVFANAVRYHTGGIAGFAPDEVGAVLKKNEEILTESDPRHRFNGGLGGKQEAPTIINAVDGSDALEQALATSRGGEVLVNYMRKNKDAVKAVLGA